MLVKNERKMILKIQKKKKLAKRPGFIIINIKKKNLPNCGFCCPG